MEKTNKKGELIEIEGEIVSKVKILIDNQGRVKNENDLRVSLCCNEVRNIFSKLSNYRSGKTVFTFVCKCARRWEIKFKNPIKTWVL